ncbi:MAG: cytochrome C oxidase subunit IV family protein [Porticoccaceae bacterium]|nr:cytochrome C oxidase subunit IV family protein [Pseudomonadales bacterium]MCP5172310.1 cytochrome C oxidase subunit IV family protein [Pseudomonadales bacterium]
MSHLLTKHISPMNALVVWLFLVVASLCTGWLGEHHGLFGRWTVAAVMIVALLKARAIILYYMEVKHAPIKLRLIFEVWVFVTPALIYGFWLAQGGVAG